MHKPAAYPAIELSKRTQAIAFATNPANRLDVGALWDAHCDDMIDPPREAKCTACGSPYVNVHGYKCPAAH